MAVTDFGNGGIERIGEGAPSGSSFGIAATDKISFYGATPVVQQTGGLSAADATTVAVTTGGYMFANSTQAASIIACAKAMQKLGLTT
jgi:hypothetical protein